MENLKIAHFHIVKAISWIRELTLPQAQLMAGRRSENTDWHVKVLKVQ